MTSLRSGLLSHVGQVRESNQDSGLATANLVVVADGMGGHRGGETASRIAVEVMRELGPIGSLDELVAAVEAANAAVFEAARNDPRLDGMGTTLTAVGVVDGGPNPMLGVVNVGDSRTYLFQGDVLRALTDDHSMVATLLRDGQITEEEALRHPHRNILTRALGVDASVEVDSWQLRPVAGDRLVLCSDGLVNEVTDEQISAVLRRLADPDEAAAELVRMANEHGGRDNVTVAVVDLVEVAAGLGLEPTAPHAISALLDDGAQPSVPLEAGRGFDEPAAPQERASRLTWRVAVFVLAILAVVVVAVLALTRDDDSDSPNPSSTVPATTPQADETGTDSSDPVTTEPSDTTTKPLESTTAATSPLSGPEPLDSASTDTADPTMRTEPPATGG